MCIIGYPLIPNEAQIPLVGREICDRNYSHLSIKEYMICGGTPEKDACSVSVCFYYKKKLANNKKYCE